MVISLTREFVNKPFKYAIHSKVIKHKFAMKNICFPKLSALLSKIYTTNSPNPSKRLNLYKSVTTNLGLAVMHSLEASKLLKDTYETLYNININTIGCYEDAADEENAESESEKDKAEDSEDDVSEVDDVEGSASSDTDLEELSTPEQARNARRSSFLDISLNNFYNSDDDNVNEQLNKTISSSNINLSDIADSNDEQEMEVDECVDKEERVKSIDKEDCESSKEEISNKSHEEENIVNLSDSCGGSYVVNPNRQKDGSPEIILDEECIRNVTLRNVMSRESTLANVFKRKETQELVFSHSLRSPPQFSPSPISPPETPLLDSNNQQTMNEEGSNSLSVAENLWFIFQSDANGSHRRIDCAKIKKSKYEMWKEFNSFDT